jgi:hypothetical protein
MIECGAATESDMVLAFLRAEVDSPRFSHAVQNCLLMLEHDRLLIDNADVADIRENGVRRALLGCYRGYGHDAYLFRGFPNDVRWRRLLLEKGDLRTLLYAREPSWIAFSDGTRLVSAGAKNAAVSPTGEGAIVVAKAIKEGTQFPELIVADAAEGPLVLVEGHTRATAHVLAGSEAVEVIIGSSKQMARWEYY